ncbi:hypothetical protein [Terrimonas pollutisoli]|uniref:hypothetical protein n=1 Tax=Terrimonas pollutisoli TaxID=3034147 RepID=UPI0023EB36B1|nr:hypothetical protein [Terrimonas sp. H1YJ31]
MKKMSSTWQWYLLMPVMLFLFSKAGYCQHKATVAKNTFYTEWTSQGPVYSINYDRIIRQGEKVDYSVRAGFSLQKDALSFPVSLSVMTGRNEHHPEFSLAVTPYIDRSKYKDQTDSYIYVNPGIGYRYQKLNGGVFIRVAAGPSIFLDPPSDDFWRMDPKLHAFASAGIGFSF